MAAADQPPEAHENPCHAGAIHTGIEVGRIGRQEEQCCTCSFDGFTSTRDLVSGKVVHDDDVARPQAWRQQRSDVSAEHLAIHGSIHDHGGDDAVCGKARDQCCCLPVAMGNGCPATLSSSGAPVKACHLGVGSAFVQEDQPFRLELQLLFKPGLARRLYVWAILFCGMGGLFLTV